MRQSEALYTIEEETQQIYHTIDDMKQKFPLVEKNRKHLLLPLREKLCFWKVFVDDSESIKNTTTFIMTSGHEVI